jgi:hypothetical protein
MDQEGGLGLGVPGSPSSFFKLFLPNLCSFNFRILKYLRNYQTFRSTPKVITAMAMA